MIFSCAVSRDCALVIKVSANEQRRSSERENLGQVTRRLSIRCCGPIADRVLPFQVQQNDAPHVPALTDAQLVGWLNR